METKPGTIVVGVDGSESSHQAVVWARDQAVAEGRALTLAHAVDVVDAVHTGTPSCVDAALIYPEETRTLLLSEGRKILATARRKVEAIAPDLEVHEVTDFLDRGGCCWSCRRTRR